MKIRPTKDAVPATAADGTKGGKSEDKSEHTLSGYDEHTMPLDKLYERYPTFDMNTASKSHGLTTKQAEARLAIDGPVSINNTLLIGQYHVQNRLTPPKGISMWTLFFKQFYNGFMIMLGGAGVLSLIVYFTDMTQGVNLVAALALIITVFLMAVMGFIEERKSLRANRNRWMQRLKRLERTRVCQHWKRTISPSTARCLARMTNAQKRGRSNMSIEVERFVRFIGFLGLGMSVVVIAIGLVQTGGNNWTQVVIYGFIVVVCSNVPQGLPGVYNRTYVSGKPDQQLTEQLEDEDFVGDETLLSSCVLINQTFYYFALNRSKLVLNRPGTTGIQSNECFHVWSDHKPNYQHRKKPSVQTVTITGNPSETALMRYAMEMTDAAALRGRYDIVFEVGAPEIIIKHCGSFVSDEHSMDMTIDFRRDFDNAYTSYGERGRRVIGFAIYHTEALPTKKWTVEDVPLGKLSFLGMVAIMDPPRDDAAIAIAQCKVNMPLGVRGYSS
ncbi:unnamed protein product [Sphagnum balticum]